MEFSDSAIPSQVTTRPWIHVSSPVRHKLTNQKTVVDINDFDSLSSTVGKWLLFHSNKIQATCGLSYHDKAWATIRTIVTDSMNTDIIGAKCSTSWQGLQAGSGNSSNGVICCYTGDYRNKESVKRAGDYIRAAHTYPGDMYYKTDNATYAGAYRHTGNKAVSMYKHSSDNNMYERDPSNPNKWILVDF